MLGQQQYHAYQWTGKLVYSATSLHTIDPPSVSGTFHVNKNYNRNAIELFVVRL